MSPSFKCPRCQDRLYLLEPLGEYVQARPCDCEQRCAACGGEGRVYSTNAEGYSFASVCHCRSIETRLARFNRAKLPARCGLTFEGYQPTNDEQRRAVNAAMATANLYKPTAPSKGFVLAGPVGSGKTHLICAALRHLTLEVGVSARYVEISFLFAEIKHGFNQGRSGLEAIQPLIDVDVLAIDELGKGRGTGFELDTLDELIARRYNAQRTTLIATNFSLADRPARAPSAYSDPAAELASGLLKDRVGERIWSRLHEMCHFIEFPPATRDWRKAKPIR